VRALPEVRRTPELTGGAENKTNVTVAWRRPGE
jgi:hypothetical protein